MKLLIEEHGQQHEVSVERRGQEVTASVNGRTYQLEVHSLADGGLLLLQDGRVCECRVDLVAGRSGQVHVTAGPREFAFQVRDPKRLPQGGGSAGTEGAAQLVAMMPGKIVRILIEAGQAVKANEAVLVVEAMKMQNELKSPRAGLVRELRVATGDTVSGGDILAVIE